MTTMSIKKSSVKRFPDSPGVYFFLKGKVVLYIGKATSLSDRVKSYFSKDLMSARGPLIEKMVSEATDIDFKKTDSVLEALILESNLIKKHQPRYNTKEKDNKSFNYVVITKEDFPKILVLRGRELEEEFEPDKIKYSFGPFPLGAQLKEALKIIRKIFPYANKCKENTGRPCFERQLGLCPGVCTGEISKKDYGKTIQNIRLLFDGKKDKILKNLEKEMKILSKNMEFEKAGMVKKQIFALQHIKDIALIKKETRSADFRIEAYDVAHLGGTNRVGVMAVIEDGIPKKSDYRKFLIKTEALGDTDALKEILERRFAHTEWPLPKLIVIDGGKQQKNIAEKVLEEFGFKIAIVSVVKDERHRPREILGDTSLKRKYERDIILANSEAHRFAISYHKKLRGRLR